MIKTCFCNGGFGDDLIYTGIGITLLIKKAVGCFEHAFSRTVLRWFKLHD